MVRAGRVLATTALTSALLAAGPADAGETVSDALAASLSDALARIDALFAPRRDPLAAWRAAPFPTAYAQLAQAQPGGSGEITLDPITVNGGAAERGDGPVQGYRATRSTTATRTDTPLIETPSSVTVIPKDLIEDRRSQTLSEALTLAPSVAQRQNFAGYESFTIRGLAQDGDNSFQIDSLRTRNTVRFDPQLFERVEVLKGPASLLYGSGEPAGIINFVTPRPTPLPLVAFGGDLASFNDARGVFDASYTFENGIGVRLPFVARRFDSFRDFVDNNRNVGVTPSVTVPLGDRTTARLVAAYVDQHLVDDTVLIPVIRNRPAPIPRTRFLGQPDAFQDNRLFQSILSVGHRFSDSLIWKNAFSYLHAVEEQDTVTNFFGVNRDRRTIDRFRAFGESDQGGLQFRSDLIADGRLGGVDHKLLAGVDLDRSTLDSLVRGDAFLVPIDIFNPVYDPTTTARNVVFDNYRQKGITRSAGFYAQDQATLLQGLPAVHKLIAVAGLRYDEYVQSYRTGGRFFGEPANDRENPSKSGLSPRLGLVYMPMEKLSLYGSYSRSFQPQVITSLADTPPSPQKGEQFEVGAKIDLTERLFVTTSVFDITKTNVPGPSLIPGITELIGEERSHGVEVEIAGEIGPGWQVFGGYAYTDATTAKGDEFSTGKVLFNAPRHRASLWSSYTVPEGPWKGIGGGAGISLQSASFGDLANLVRLPGYPTVDAALWYKADVGKLGLSPTFQPHVQVGVKNLTDEAYFLSGNGFNSLQPGTPRTVYVSAGARF